MKRSSLLDCLPESVAASIRWEWRRYEYRGAAESARGEASRTVVTVYRHLDTTDASAGRHTAAIFW